MNNNMISTTPQRDAALFLRIAAQGAALSSHSDLTQWLQGDVQRWLSHDAMVVACGDVHSGRLHCEVFSGSGVLRSLATTPGCMEPLLGYLRDCWAAAQHAPCQVELVECEPPLRDCTPVQRQALAGMHAAIVHGTMNRLRGTQRIFAALTPDP